MEHDQLSKVARQFKRTFSADQLNALGKEVRFCLRKRTITPHRLALGLIEVFAHAQVRTIADVHRAFNALCEANVQYKPFHNQLAKDQFPTFMRSLCLRLMEQLSGEVMQFDPESPFAQFERIELQDGSSFALKWTLSESFPGRFTRTNPSAVELHVTFDLLREQPRCVVLTPDTESEAQFLPPADELSGCLLMADRGYFKKEYLANVMAEDGCFIIRAKSDLNPTVTFAVSADGRERPHWCGKSLRAIKPKFLKRQPMDMDVQWRVKGNDIACRLIVCWNPVRRDYHYLLTNLQRTEFSIDQILAAYRLRWQIGVSSKGHIIQSVKVRPRLKDSSLVAWEAPWRESKAVEPSDNILRKEDAQRTRLQRTVNVEVASSHVIPVAETVDNARRQQGPFETSLRRRSSPAGYQRRHGTKDYESTGEALGARRRKLVEEARPITLNGKWRRRRQGGGSGRSTVDRRAAKRARKEGPEPMSGPLHEVRQG